MKIKINPFVPNAPLRYPLRTSDFRGQRKGALGTNGLIFTGVEVIAVLNISRKKPSDLPALITLIQGLSFSIIKNQLLLLIPLLLARPNIQKDRLKAFYRKIIRTCIQKITMKNDDECLQQEVNILNLKYTSYKSYFKYCNDNISLWSNAKCLLKFLMQFISLLMFNILFKYNYLKNCTEKPCLFLKPLILCFRSGKNI